MGKSKPLIHEPFNTVIRKLKREYSSIALKYASSIAMIEPLSTGIPDLDKLLDGGYRGIVEIAGHESTGKTTLALHAIAAMQHSQEIAVALYLDCDRKFNPAYASALGVDLSRLLICHPHHTEMAFDVILQSIGATPLIVIDSVSSIVPRDAIGGWQCAAIREETIDQGLRSVLCMMNQLQSATTLLCIDQYRPNRVLYGNPDTSTGGAALRSAASLRLDVRRVHTLVQSQTEYGVRTKIKCLKSIYGRPFRSIELDLVFGVGFLTSAPTIAQIDEIHIDNHIAN
jgi:recombination protein RecA